MTRTSFTTRALGLVAASGLLFAAPVNALDPNAPKTSNTAMAVSDDGGSGRSGFLSGIFGCASDGNKQVGVAAVGGVLGGFLGNRIAGRGSRTLGTIIGGALGAAAGSAIGCKLQKNDQAKAEKAMEDAVATGKNQSWENPETGASGQVEVSGGTGSGIGDLRFAKGVEPAGGYSKVGATYVATAAANVRSRPGTDGAVVSKLTTGQRVWVPASVSGAPWFLISDQGEGQGYVSNALLKREATQTASACKMVKQTVDTPDAGSATETYQACKGKDGNWTMTRV
jgi:surface antigen